LSRRLILAHLHFSFIDRIVIAAIGWVLEGEIYLIAGKEKLGWARINSTFGRFKESMNRLDFPSRPGRFGLGPKKV